MLEFVGGQPLDLLYVSAVTLAEIRFGIELVAEPGRRAELNDWLAHKVRPMFEQRVLPVSEDIMFKCVSACNFDPLSGGIGVQN